LEKNGFKKRIGNTLYIRPFMIAVGSGVIAQPSNAIPFYDYTTPADRTILDEAALKNAQRHH
jgi:branched-chain amino acid aminotransferase